MKKRIVKSRIEHLLFIVDQTKCIKNSPLLLLIKHSSTMNGYHSSSDDSNDTSDESSESSNATIEWSDDNFDMMAVVAVVLLVNYNNAMANLIAEANHTQMINDVVAPNQDYRHGGRRPKALFRYHEALHCIRRDYFGIPGDLTTPIFEDRNFEMMFRLSRTRVQKNFEGVMHSDQRSNGCPQGNV